MNVPAPSTSDGVYKLVDPEPESSPAPAEPAARPAAEAAPAPWVPGMPVPAPEPTPSSASATATATATNKPAIRGLTRLFGSRKPKDDPSAHPATPSESKSGSESAAATPAPAPRTASQRRRRGRHYAAPAFVVSMLVHVAVLSVLAVYTLASNDFRKKLTNLNTSLLSDTKGSSEELLKIDAPAVNGPHDQAVGSTTAAPGGGGGGGESASTFGALGGLGSGSGPPSATPRIGGVGRVSERGSLPGVKVVAQVSGLSLLPAAPGKDLGGGGGIAGDVTFAAGEIGEALDQLAREILRHLADHRLTVVWLFDESNSMKDDQQAVKDKFDRVSLTLKEHADAARNSPNALTHVIVGYGKELHFELDKPTADIDRIGRAIEHLRIDESGEENVLHAVQAVIARYGKLIGKDRRLLIVLVTDESGDDGSYIEEARQAAVSRRVPIYVIGRQSLFGFSQAHLQYIDPVTKDVYWPTIRRGPETADLEALQWDGLHDRWDEQPSGFAPYELARLTKDTGGIYFLLPSEETMRVRQREKKYSMTTLKEYVPDYESRAAYNERRMKSELRRTLYQVIQETRHDGKNPLFKVRRHFPINPPELIPAATEAGQLATLRLKELLTIEGELRKRAKLRDREPERRWQAAYDLMLAQIVSYQVKTFEYRACMAEMIKKPPKPGKMPSKDLVVQWEINHARDRKAPPEQTEKKYAEAERLLKLVIERHPNTPWADLAQDELNHGLGVKIDEWYHSGKYEERAKLIPKY